MIAPPIDFNVSGVEFMTAGLATAAPFFWLPAVRLRQLAWAAGTALVLWIVLPNAASWAALGSFLVSGYAVARALERRPSGVLMAGYLTALVAAFLALKQYAVIGWIFPFAVRDVSLLGLARITGLSYILFRQIHFLVDSAQGQVERPFLWDYLNYQLNFFTLLAGPIQRFQDFQAQWAALQPTLADPHELLDNAARLLWGVLKLALIAPFFFEGWDELQGTLLHAHTFGLKYLVEFPVVFYFYPIYLYCNFSGYCDIVVAMGRFFGMRFPENFDRPWLARNVIEFWTRWHITLGTWIRDYLFMTLYKPMVERWPRRAPSFVWIAYFFAFAVAGVWHGTTMNFFLYGVWQGIGISVTKLWENRIVARRGRQGLQEYLRSRSIRWAAVFANFQFQCVSLLIFSQRDPLRAWRLLRGVALALRHP